MSSPFAFDIQFSPRESAARDALDRVAEAEIGLFAGILCLTELEDRMARTVRPTFRASTYRLTFWLAENWWRLCWEPEADHLDWQLSHNLAAIGAGYLWPSLTFISDGEDVTLRMRSSTVAATEDIRYLVQQDLRISLDAWVSGVDRFIGAVIERMRTSGHKDTELEALWNEIQEERRDAQTARWRKLEALAGLDPGAESGAFLDTLLARQSEIGPSGLEELVAACKDATQATLNRLANIREHSASGLAMPNLESLRQRIHEQLNSKRVSNSLTEAQEPPWQRAYEVADAVRDDWALGSGAISNAQLAEALGAEQQLLLTPNASTLSPISAGFRDEHSGHFAVAIGARAPTGRRFAVARLLGDYLATSDAERLLPATTTKTARQKFQRAFAQQLLCPVEDLKAFLDTEHPSDDHIEEAAAEFHVSPLLIKTTLVNQGWLGREFLQAF